MNSKKFFYVMVGIIGLMGILVVGTVVAGDQYLHKQSDKLVSLKLDNQVVEEQQTSLVQAKKDIEKYSELNSIAKQIVPQDKDQAKATREIINIASQAGIKISSISFPSSNLGQPQVKAPAATDGSAATAIPATPTVTQVKPVTGIQGLYQLDITIISDAASPSSYTGLIDFLNRLEQNRRTAQVSQIAIQPDSKNRSGLNFTLTITLYIKP